jgi:hypothetical protein
VLLWRSKPRKRPIHRTLEALGDGRRTSKSAAQAPGLLGIGWNFSGIHEIEAEAAIKRSRTGSQPLGTSAILGRHPHDRLSGMTATAGQLRIRQTLAFNRIEVRRPLHHHCLVRSTLLPAHTKFPSVVGGALGTRGARRIRWD